MPGDQDRRFDFCNFVLNTLDENPDFFNEVLWSDECHFLRQGTINTQNRHYWSLENAHLIQPNRHRERWSANVWCGIWKSILIGPIYFDGSLTSESYTGKFYLCTVSRFFRRWFPYEICHACVWYQHYGAPAHKSTQPCTFLAQTFDTRIFNYGGQEVAEATGGVSDTDLVLHFCERQSF
ncbi:uncharacterized protein TNCV_3765281 [Trichonephila clavipes]|nr:uncharacterized protein TNCV_3765281 [Trichonephila clavipes]